MALKTKKKTPSRSSLIKKFDYEFSRYIRTRFSKNGNSECFTCGKIDNWKNLQCGHFMSRKNYSTRWNETNCQVQCVGCNVYRYGEQFTFGQNLNKTYGDDTAANLLLESKQVFKITSFELEEKIEYYKKLNTMFENKNK
jgi:hypothetical protein